MTNSPAVHAPHFMADRPTNRSMDHSPGQAGEGLRVRRRRETHARIRAVALELVGEHGLDRVTVDMISSRAGVSVRTFFNYFPNKVAALVDLPAPPPDDAAVVAFVTAGGRDDLLADVAELVATHLDALGIDRTHARTRIEIIESTPQMLAPQLAVFDAYERQLADLIIARLTRSQGDPGPRSGDKPQPTDEGYLGHQWTARLVAAMAVAAARTSICRWCLDPNEASAESSIRRSMATLGVLFASSTAPGSTAPGSTGPGSTAPGSTAPGSTANGQPTVVRTRVASSRP